LCWRPGTMAFAGGGSAVAAASGDACAASDADRRDRVVKQLRDVFNNDANAGDICIGLEAAMSKANPPSSREYRANLNRVMTSLRGPRNDGVRQALLQGTCQPDKFLTMKPAELKALANSVIGSSAPSGGAFRPAGAPFAAAPFPAAAPAPGAAQSAAPSAAPVSPASPEAAAPVAPPGGPVPEDPAPLEEPRATEATPPAEVQAPPEADGSRGAPPALGPSVTLTPTGPPVAVDLLSPSTPQTVTVDSPLPPGSPVENGMDQQAQPEADAAPTAPGPAMAAADGVVLPAARPAPHVPVSPLGHASAPVFGSPSEIPRVGFAPPGAEAAPEGSPQSNRLEQLREKRAQLQRKSSGGVSSRKSLTLSRPDDFAVGDGDETAESEVVQELGNVKRRNAALQQQVDAATARIEELELALTERTQEVAALTQVNSGNHNGADAQSAIDAANAAASSARQAAESWQARAAQLEEQVQQLDLQLAQANGARISEESREAERASSDAATATAVAAAQLARDENHQLRARVMELEAQVSDLQGLMGSKAGDGCAETTSEAGVKLQGELEESRATLAEYKLAAERAQFQMEQKVKEIQALQNLAAKAKALDSERKQALAENELLRKEVKAVRRDLRKERGERMSLGSQVVELQRDLDDATSAAGSICSASVASGYSPHRSSFASLYGARDVPKRVTTPEKAGSISELSGLGVSRSEALLGQPREAGPGETGAPEFTSGAAMRSDVVAAHGHRDPFSGFPGSARATDGPPPRASDAFAAGMARARAGLGTPAVAVRSGQSLGSQRSVPTVPAADSAPPPTNGVSRPTPASSSTEAKNPFG